MGADAFSDLGDFSPLEIGLGLLLLFALVYSSRAAILLWRLGLENRRLRRGLRGYAEMERHHAEVTRENRERNDFQERLPVLISALHAERTVEGICRRIVEFTARVLGASEASLYLREGSSLVLREARAAVAPTPRIPLGQGRIGVVGQLRRILAAEDFAGLDPTTRASAAAGPSRPDTQIAAPLLAHGELLGVLNVGGTVSASAALRKEILSVVAQLGATALENQLNFERLEREATTDGLTGLSNVRNFRQKFAEELSRAARFGRPCSVFLFDLDHFKHYNDRNGHPAGDDCLKLTAEVLRANSRATDLPARYGGEEFIVLLPETDRAGALAFAEKIRAAIEATEYPHRESQPLGFVSISGGVATFPDDGTDPESLIAAADEALYRSKQAGRNRIGAASGKPAAA